MMTDADVDDSACVQDLDNFCASLLSHNALLIHYQTHNSYYSNQTTMLVQLLIKCYTFLLIKHYKQIIVYMITVQLFLVMTRLRLVVIRLLSLMIRLD